MVCPPLSGELQVSETEFALLLATANDGARGGAAG